MDVKFLTFIGKCGEKIRRFQYTAIDDATRVRALKVYDKHTQSNGQDFVYHIIEKFPFRIKEIRTDNGHEFQAKFHWHVEDQGIRHAYIKRRTPQLNGKVERSHRSDQQEFYQLLSYKGDVDLEAKLSEWENFHNFNRPHDRQPYKENIMSSLRISPKLEAVVFNFHQALHVMIAQSICAPMFMVTGPSLVTEACKAGVMGGLPRQNARTFEQFEGARVLARQP
eukprot:gene40470-54730_t